MKFAALVAHDKLLSDARAPPPATTTQVVGNPDEIALDDSDEDKAGNPDEIELDMDSDDELQKDDDAAEQTQPTRTASSIPLESIDQVASLPETEAREKVHEIAGTEVEDVQHAKEAIVAEETMDEGAGLETRFLALDKCGFGRDFIQVRLLSPSPPRK